MRPEFGHCISQLLTFGGALAVALGGLGSSYYGKKISDTKQIQIDKQALELKSLSQENLKLTKKNHDAANAIQLKADELTAQGSYPSGIIEGELDGGKQSQLIILLSGQYAIQNLTAKIVIIPDYSSVSGLDPRVIGMNHPTHDLGTLRPSEGKTILVDTLTKETAITIYYKSDNNSWTESIRIKDTDQGRKFLWYTEDESGVLSSHIDPDFPNNNGDVVIWSNVTKNISEFD